MDINRSLSLQQERLVYKRAVRMTLETFFEKSKEESSQLVDSWWKRLGTGELFLSGLFMHDEPLNVAADLAGVKVPQAKTLGERYQKVLMSALPKSRHGRRPVAGTSRIKHRAA
jgi:cytochrome P450